MKKLAFTLIIMVSTLASIAQNVTQVELICTDAGDTKDKDTKVRVEIAERRGSDPAVIFAKCNNTGYYSGNVVKWNVVIRKPFTVDKIVQLKRLFIELQPNGHDKWAFAGLVVFKLDDGTQRTYNLGYKEMGNHDGWVHMHDDIIKGLDKVTSDKSTFYSSNRNPSSDDNVKEAKKHINWALGDDGPCSRFTVCIQWNRIFIINGTPCVLTRYDKSAHDMIVYAKAAQMANLNDLAVDLVASTQIHDPDGVMTWVLTHGGDVLTALNTTQVVELSFSNYKTILHTLGIPIP
jgi:hypothetical protein